MIDATVYCCFVTLDVKMKVKLKVSMLDDSIFSIINSYQHLYLISNVLNRALLETGAVERSVNDDII